MKIENEDSVRRKAQVEREKKLKHEDLVSIITDKTGEKSGNKNKKSSMNERVAWSKFVED